MADPTTYRKRLSAWAKELPDVDFPVLFLQITDADGGGWHIIRRPDTEGTQIVYRGRGWADPEIECPDCEGSGQWGMTRAGTPGLPLVCDRCEGKGRISR